MDRCLEKVIHTERVKQVAGRMPENDVLQGVADIFKALSDAGRVKIVLALAEAELCVCDLAAMGSPRYISELRLPEDIATLRGKSLEEIRG